MINKKIHQWHQYTTPVLLLSILFFTLPGIAADTPLDALKAFYKHLSKQECEDALKLRPDYSLQRCKKISKVHIHKVSTELSDNSNAVLLLELDSFYDKKKNYFFGYVRMARKNGKWLVIGPFKNKEDYWLDEYVKSYIPGEFKGLPESVKKKKFAPPPVPKLASEKASQEEDIIAEEKIVPPGDSIDADEFILKQTDKPQNKVVNNTKYSAKNTPVIATSTNPEIDKFLNGDYAIQGNYTSLLTKIRKNFPADANTIILLIDKSSHIIYLYNSQNLLLAFFPVFSSDNSNFPSGLYRANLNKPLRSKTNKETQSNQAIILTRIPKQNNKNNPLFYIRDLFDTDTKNSLQLSPIDNNRLQQLISISAIAYIGQ
jgi:hypothetical protein